MQSEQRKTSERLDGMDARLDHIPPLSERNTSVEQDVQELTSFVKELSFEIMRLRAAR